MTDGAQCCMCGKTCLSTIEDGGPECELADGRWVCSSTCYVMAVDTRADLAAALLKAEEALDDAIRIAARNEAGPDLDAARATLTEIRKLTGAK